MSDFFHQYFLDPIVQNTGYNAVNTLVFASIFVVAVFFVYKLIKKMGIEIDRKFFFGVLPFVAMGGILRAWEDLIEATGNFPSVFNAFAITDAFGVKKNILFVTPAIYVSIFFVALVSLIASKAVYNWKKIEYWKSWLAIGLIADIIFLLQLRFASYFAFFAVIGITSVWVALTFFSRKISPRLKKFLSDENAFLINVHLFDASTTFIALQFPGELGINYFEQHVLAGFTIGILGPASMFLLKLIVVPVVLYFFDKDLAKETEKRTFLKIVVLIMGMGPGLRNFLRMVSNV